MAIPAGYSLKHIVVNVQAANLKPVVFKWDAECGNGCIRTAPDPIALDVPSGSARLIQFLGIYKESSTDASLIYYGDTVTDLNGGPVDVTVTINAFGAPSTAEGVIAGQYVFNTELVSSTLVGRGPTGVLDMFFAPPNGSAPMLVESTEIFNGWFSAFGTPGAPLEYVIRGGGKLSDGGVSLTMDRMITRSTSAAADLVRMDSPSQFWVADGGGSSRRKQSGGIHMLGFFGPAAGTLSGKACYPSSASLVSFWDASTGGSNLTYCSSGCTTESIKRVGAAGIDSSSCSVGNELVSEISYDPYGLGNGKWDSLAFRGPFRKAYYSHSPGMGYNCYSGSKFADACYDPSGTPQIAFQWDYIPHVFTSANAITGASLFTKVYPNGCEEGEACREEYRPSGGGDNYDCPNLASRGFNKLGDFGPNGKTFNLSVPGGLPLGSRMVALLCPYRMVAGAPEYFRSAVEFQDLRAPPNPLPGLKVTSSLSGDDSVDTYLVDAVLAGSAFTASSSAISGAVKYEYVVSNLGTPVCSNFGPSPSVSLPGCTIGSMYPDNTQFLLEGTAYDANNKVLARSSYNFRSVIDVPAATTAIIGCGTWNGGVNVAVTIQLTSVVGATSFDWLINWGATNMASGMSVTPGLGGGQNYSIDSGMTAASNYSGIQSTVTLRHPSGYTVTQTPQTFNYTSAGNICP